MITVIDVSNCLLTLRFFIVELVDTIDCIDVFVPSTSVNDHSIDVIIPSSDVVPHVEQSTIKFV